MSKENDEEVEAVDEGARSFTRVLDQMSYGDTVPELSIELRELCSKLLGQARRHEAPAKGSMTLTIDIVVAPRGEMQLAMTTKNTVKKPKAVMSSAWLTEQGNVSFENPRQQSLALREVHHDPETGEVKDVHAKGNEE